MPALIKQLLIRKTGAFAFIFILIFACTTTSGDLPSLGDPTSGTVSTQYERQIGQIFLKMLHRQLPTINDPEINTYLEGLVYKLAEASQLQDRRISIVLIDSPQFNAFAAPGGIIGINAGVFLYAESEQEFASVVAHEIAHISQRHYARRVEAAERQRLPTMAALLGSIVLAAAGGGDVGVAALSTTIATAQNEQLRFSRENEKEADRIGILTMVRAGMDPRAMPQVFERLSRTETSSSQQLEFLRTHPITQNRISDSRSRAEQYPAQDYQDNKAYHQMRARIRNWMTASTPDQSARRFRADIESKHSSDIDTSRYGLAVAELWTRNYQAAQNNLKPLLAKNPNDPHYIMLSSRIEQGLGNTSKAMKIIQNALAISPGNYAMEMTLNELLYEDRQYQKSMHTLRSIARRRPEDPHVWYKLAESAGLAGDIMTVHTSRAEYFFLTGSMDDAIKHLEYARDLPGTDFSQRAAMNEKIKEVNNYKKEMKL